jgi:polyphenol oxidase
MKLFKGDKLNPENQEYRKKLFKTLEIEENNVVYSFLQGGINVKVVGNRPDMIPKIDALVTKRKNVYLSVTAADCIPVLFYDPYVKIIGIAHAGWRGIVGGIIKNTVDKIIELGGNYEHIAVAMGPGINACHYSIKPEFLDKFDNYKDFLTERDGLQFADLKGMIRKQLLDLGINPENIENNNDCTFDHEDKYFSHRRDKTNEETMEAMLALIGMK